MCWGTGVEATIMAGLGAERLAVASAAAWGMRGRGGSRRVLGRNFLPASHAAPLRGGCCERRLRLSRLAHACPGVGFFLLLALP